MQRGRAMVTQALRGDEHSGPLALPLDCVLEADDSIEYRAAGLARLCPGGIYLFCRPVGVSWECWGMAMSGGARATALRVDKRSGLLALPPDCILDADASIDYRAAGLAARLCSR
eukprot:6872680-Pyramimonas_sp.AAC.1